MSSDGFGANVDRGAPAYLDIIERYLGVGTGEAEAWAHAFTEIRVRGGDWLFRQGDDGASMYFLTRGRMQVWIEHDGTPRLVSELEPGACIGEIGLLTGDVRSAGIRAVRDCQLVELDRPAFERLAAERPTLAVQLAGAVARRLADRTSGQSQTARRGRTAAVLALSDAPAAGAFCRELVQSLESTGTVLCLTPARLAEAGAPDGDISEDGTVGEALRRWISDQEDRYRLVVFIADDERPRWTAFIQRQSDLVLWVADADDDPQRCAERQGALRPEHVDIGHHFLVLTRDANAAPKETRRWLDALETDHHLHHRNGHDGDLQRIVRIVRGEGFGLVLGGGAARGFAELGVYRAMSEIGVPVDWVGGTSIGSIMGAAIALGLGPEVATERAREAFVGGRPFGDYTLPVLSLLKGLRMERLLAEYLPGDIEDLPLPFFCISSNLGRGVKNLHDRGSLAAACRASASMPGIFPPAVVDGELCVDGAVLDNLPVDEMRNMPVRSVVAVDVSSRLRQTVPFDHVPTASAILGGRYLPFVEKKHVPSLMTVMLKATEIGTLQRVRAQGDAADLLVNPPVRKFGMTDVKSFDRIVNAGYEHALEQVGEWWAAYSARSTGQPM